MSYVIVHKNDYRELVDSVQSYLDAGWKLLGSVVVTSYVNVDGESWTTFTQALVKEG